MSRYFLRKIIAGIDKRCIDFPVHALQNPISQQGQLDEMKLLSVLLALTTLASIYCLNVARKQLSESKSLLAKIVLVTTQKTVSIDRGEDKDPLVGEVLHLAYDIDRRVAQLSSNYTIEEFSKTLAEVDEWLFAPEEEKHANEILEDKVGQLRTKIEDGINILLKEAITAADGKAATQKMTQISSLLGLYPSPKTEEQRASLEQITSRIQSTYRRIEDIRRLRYNQWVVDQIKQGQDGYYAKKRTFGTDQDALTNACIEKLKTIDPAFLEPAVLDLYNHVFGLTRDALDDVHKVKLAKGLTAPDTQRKTPLNF